MLCPLHTSTGPFFFASNPGWFQPAWIRTLSPGMKTLLLRLALVVALAFAALALVAPAAAQTGPATTQSAESGRDILPVVLWFVAGVGLGVIVMGTLYLFKRRVGGFPENPSWTAPISVMRSRDLPGDDAANGHGGPHDAHGAGHAPAH